MPTSGWEELTAQKLVRYEALFRLLDETQALEDIHAIAQRVAGQWKYFANVTSWRLIATAGNGFVVIDGHRGRAQVAEVADISGLSEWDAHHWARQSPRRLCAADVAVDGPTPPEHLAEAAIAELEVLPLIRGERRVGLLTAAARRPFSELDSSFTRLYSSHFADRVSAIMLRREATEALIHKATRDQLTGLWNRGAVLDRLTELLDSSTRTGQPVAVVIADLDHFKAVNDGYGHLVGDEVLREVARRLARQSRGTDVVGRFGGEEFLFALHPCGPQDLAAAAERLRRAVADAPLILGGGTVVLDVTMSLGAVSSAAHPNDDLESLLKLADDALYRSKAAGRNRTTLA